MIYDVWEKNGDAYITLTFASKEENNAVVAVGTKNGLVFTQNFISDGNYYATVLINQSFIIAFAKAFELINNGNNLECIWTEFATNNTHYYYFDRKNNKLCFSVSCY